MKKIIYSFAILAGITLSTSCNDFLTEEERGKENLETYFSTPDEVESAVGGCYYQIAKGGGWWQIYNTWLLSDMTTDDLWDGNTTQEDGYQTNTHFLPTAGTEEGILQNFWGARYQGINSCNLCIERIPNVEMDENLKKRRIAEVRFLRAFFYFDLVRNFGGVPLQNEYGSTGNGVGRSSQEDCYKFIEDELQLAIPDLPERSQLAAADMGRITKGAALGILGKAQLYQAKWGEAKATLKKIIDSGEYRLLDNFGDVWSVKHNNSAESLFEVQQTYGGDTYALGGSLTVVTGCRNGVGDGWSWGQPTSDLENAFIAAGDTERLRWTIIKTMCTEIAGESKFSEFVSNNKSVCGINDAKYNDYKDKFGWTAADYYKGYIIDPAQHKSARIIRKYFVPLEDRPEIYNIDKIPLNHRVLRYADVLLMYAEACAETGDDSQGQWALNKVRNRVHLNDVTATGTALRDAIRNERRLELAHEQCRLYDLRRWDCENGKKMMCNIMGPNGSFVKYNMGPDADMYEKWNQGEPSDKGIRFQEDRDLLYPIPYYEIVHSNGVITQNPGWN
ncbi:MAG: RagB/SusD family nutrient uptake outer membrane protein [Muribaculaceae bacterium]|nr:RagB/SusD family nutrient uptake outer membrane protein [Muribaculaceae bacterium]